MLTICCYFWLDPARQRSYRLTPDDVRVWDSMIARNLTVPHRRVCITHRPDLIDFMETVPINTAKHVPGTCGVKLMHWREDIGDILGKRILVSDIDIVVTGNIDDIVNRDEDVVLFRNPNYEPGGRRAYYQGSLQLLTAGARPFLYDDFDPRETPSWLNRRFGGFEQCWISERLNTAFPEPGEEWTEASWDQGDGIYGLGRLFDGRQDKGISELPENAKIVVVPGNRAPSQPELQAQHPWVVEHWR